MCLVLLTYPSLAFEACNNKFLLLSAILVFHDALLNKSSVVHHVCVSFQEFQILFALWRQLSLLRGRNDYGRVLKCIYSSEVVWIILLVVK